MSVSITPFANVALQAQGGGGVVTVSDEAVFDISNANRIYTAGVRYNLDGTLDANVNSSYSQRNASTDWIIPNSTSEDEDYEIRFTNYTGFGPSFAFGTEDVWEDLDGPKDIRIFQSLTAFQSQSSSFTIEIRINGGAVIDSGVINLNIENFGF